jgi:hypothetical protein
MLALMSDQEPQGTEEPQGKQEQGVPQGRMARWRVRHRKNQLDSAAKLTEAESVRDEASRFEQRGH